MTERRVLFVNWQAMNGAAQGKRKLVLRPNQRGAFTCPVALCLHADFKSSRGLRKHIDTKHSWYYYFDKQPNVKREEIEHIQPPIKRASTHSRPHYSMENGIGKDFLNWLCTTCGGGKSLREAKQSAKRALKFLMECTGDNADSAALSHELIDCCLGNPSIIIKFLTTLEKDWKLSYSGSLNYIHSINDLLDFRKSAGISDSNLRVFTVAEVYLRRAKENFSKRKRLECTRNFDLETLIARESWATIEEMENVIPYHIKKFQNIVEKCKKQVPVPSKQELCFCTRFITTYLFLRVKCSRPMTFQFLSLSMIEKAKTNGGFIDQREFKTSDKYLFDTLIMTDEVFAILDVYVEYVRPLLNPQCDYLLISSTGNQYKSLTTAMTMLVHEAIGKYIHPTRYRQIVETTSAERLTREEQEVISEDQKHSSTVAKVYYKKKQSRNVAIQGRQCMEKLIGEKRKETSNNISEVLNELNSLNKSFDSSVMRKSEAILKQANNIQEFIMSSSNTNPSVVRERFGTKVSSSNRIETSPDKFMGREVTTSLKDHSNHIEEQESSTKSIETSPYKTYCPSKVTRQSHADRLLQMSESLLSNNWQSLNNQYFSNSNVESNLQENVDIVVTKTIRPSEAALQHQKSLMHSREEISKSVKTKQEEIQNHFKQSNGTKNKKFSVEEDQCLLNGIQKYGKGRWAAILKDKEFKFHGTRTRDSLRMRAESSAFKKTLQT